MDALITFAVLGLVFVFAWFLTHRALPFAFVKIGRLFGFQMKVTPLTEKRIKKFRSIKRGYYCYVFISTLLVMSLFLEFAKVSNLRLNL